MIYLENLFSALKTIPSNLKVKMQIIANTDGGPSLALFSRKISSLGKDLVKNSGSLCIDLNLHIEPIIKYFKKANIVKSGNAYIRVEYDYVMTFVLKWLLIACFCIFSLSLVVALGKKL